jgi:glutamate dehydrogenase (NAD(P)+)/glutamate dehydrogenase (NADP+)
MKQWIDMIDEIGPEKIVHVYDPVTGMKGVVVIDSTPNTFIAAGGIRMLPDITTEEIVGPAREV